MKMLPLAPNLMRASFASRNRSAGFSLVEMIVVVAAIVILVAILFPVGRKAIANGQRTKCAGQLRQIGVGLGMAVADTGHYPGCVPEPGLGWYDVVGNYLSLPNDYAWPRKLDKVFLCPARKYTDGAFLGYGYNYAGFGYSAQSDGGANLPDHQLPPKYWRLSPVRVDRPAKRIVIADNFEELSLFAGPNLYLAPQYLAVRHGGGGNFLFADGHLEWLTPEKIAVLTSGNPADNPFNPLP